MHWQIHCAEISEQWQLPQNQYGKFQSTAPGPCSSHLCLMGILRFGAKTGDDVRKVGRARWVWRHTAAVFCVMGGWKFSDTELQERKSFILAHCLLRSVHYAGVQSLGLERGHVVTGHFALLESLWSFLLPTFFNRWGVHWVHSVAGLVVVFCPPLGALSNPELANYCLNFILWVIK